MLHTLSDAYMCLCVGFILLYLFLSIIMSALYRFAPQKWKYHEKLWRPFGSICATYVSGIIIWVATSCAISRFIIIYSTNEPSQTIAPYLTCLFLFLIIPFIGLIVYLFWNLVLSFDESVGSKGKEYEQEVELIKFVERHSNYMIYGITGVFIASQLWTAYKDKFPLVYLFMILSMLFSVCGVLPLIWSPKGDGKHLEWLRNYKTVWYGYSIYLFMAGIVALAFVIL